jgi:hypothetical protein
MHLMEATYYVLSLLSQGFEAAEGRKPVAEPEFRPFNLSVLRRSSVRVERTNKPLRRNGMLRRSAKSAACIRSADLIDNVVCAN